jgi:hypothetical protein
LGDFFKNSSGHPAQGRCYGHIFPAIFAEKMELFSQNRYDHIFAQFSFVLRQKRQFFRQFFWLKYF